MRKKIIPYLLGMLLLLVTGSIGAGVLIGSTSYELDRLVELHRMDQVRRDVLDSFWAVYKVLLDMRTGQPKELDTVILNVERLHKSTLECSSCHHSGEMVSRFRELEQLMDNYEQALSFFITSSANANRSELLGMQAVQAGGAVLDRVERLSVKANDQMRDNVTKMVDHVHQAALIFFGTLLLVVALGVLLTFKLVRAVSRPIEALIEGTRQIASGRLEHEIVYKEKDEFGELARQFNAMGVELQKAYGQLEERNEELRLEIEEHQKAESDRRKLLEELLQARKLEAVGTLAGGIAHEFNNLLQVIHGAADYVSESLPEGDTRARNMRVILGAAGRGADLTKRLLTFSRRVEGDMRPLDLNDAAVQLREMLGNILPETIAFELRMSDEPVYIFGDLAAIEQVLLNLATNARDAMPGGGRLTLGVAWFPRELCPANLNLPSRSPGAALLEMTDNGVGMDADTREKIFEPFFTTKEVGTGTGLGLAVVYGVVQGHGGVVECTSTPGWGTTFRIWLPMIQAAEIGARRSWAISEETGTPREGLDPINGSGKTILLADGEAPVRATTADLLGSMGFRVIQAATCEEALDNCRRYFASIDLVLLGHGLPGIDGRNCLKEILLIDPRAAVIVAAGPGGEELRETVVEEGAKGFLRKPYGPQTLSAALQSALRA